MNDHTNLYHEAFTIGVLDVVQTMTGLEVEEDQTAQGQTDFCDPENQQPCAMSGAMLLLGKHNGLATVSMTREAASILVAYMTGIPPHELTDEDLFDGIAEVMNLIAGRAKLILRETDYHYDITPPFTIVGDNHYIVHKNSSYFIQKRFFTGDLSFILRVFQLQ